MKIENWHIASIRTDALNGRYWSHSGHWWALARNGAVANDPKRTFDREAAQIKLQTSDPSFNFANSNFVHQKLAHAIIELRKCRLI